MRWRSSSTTLVPVHASPVPDTQTLRESLLRASWQRSQRVARRRLAWRWLVWCLPRYLLPGLVLSAAGIGVWQALQPGQPHPAADMSQPPVNPTASAPDGLNVAADSVPSSSPAPLPKSPDEPLRLTTEYSWGMPLINKPTNAPPFESVSPIYDTKVLLKPDNWLHSKEP